MAKVQNPLFSFAAGGSIGKLTFCHGANPANSIHIARKKPAAPSAPRSSNQISCNNRFKLASASFESLNATERNWWLAHGETPTKYGRAWYIAEFVIQRIEPPDQPLKPIPRWTAP